MDFKLDLNCDNAAFDGDNATREIARILRDAADKLESGKRSSTLKDINGNIVGQFEICE